MKREWKPGDVAVATMYTRGGPRLVRRRDSSSYPWEVIGGDDLGGGVTEAAIREARPIGIGPLVIIDPGDRAAVERLRDGFRVRVPGDSIEDWQSALREFADPTQPVDIVSRAADKMRGGGPFLDAVGTWLENIAHNWDEQSGGCQADALDVARAYFGDRS